jgi:hypothetical protein
MMPFWTFYFDSPGDCIFERKDIALWWMNRRFEILRIGYSIHVKDKINGMYFATRKDFILWISPIRVKSNGKLISAARLWINNQRY